MRFRLRVNGADREVDVDADTPLLYVLRNDLGLKGSRYGCGAGYCGACMVLLDGAPQPSCDVPVESVGRREVTTVEGLCAPRLVEAFVAEQAAQCGYCSSGILVTAAALLASNPRASDAEVRKALANNLCRCGSHPRVLSAIRRAIAEGAV